MGTHRRDDAHGHHRPGQPHAPALRRGPRDAAAQERRAGRRQLRPAHRDQPARERGLLRRDAPAVLRRRSPSPGSSSSWRRTPPSTASRCSGSILARDGYLPRQLHTRGDRLAYSNGIVLLAGFAIVLIVAFDAQVTKLIQLYIVGVFISFTLSQTGMIRHWTRLLAVETDAARRGRMQRSRVINSVGLVMTGTVLVIVLITKFTRGAWIALAAMAVALRADARHPPALRPGPDASSCPRTTSSPQPSRNHAVVLVSKLHAPTLRALAYAKATRPHDLTALTVSVDPEDTHALQAEWDRRGHRHRADRGRLAVPRDHQADPGLREADPARLAPRRGHRLHPRVRRRPLVGAAAAQPERPAPQGPAAVPARRHGHLGALPAAVLGPAQGRRRGRRSFRRPQ